MKSIELFCVSPASTAICSSTNQRSMVRHGTRPIDQYRRKGRPPVPCSSLPIDPKRYYRQKGSAKQSDLRRRSSADITDLATPPGSSRYLSSDRPFFHLVSDSGDHLTAPLPPSQPVKPDQLLSSSNDSPALKSSSTRSRSRSGDQVVELRVSIHCKGCEGKVRKHISRMEGVTSFSIDLATKKVTVIGDVTPLGVLTSISRVKSAQFWPSPTSLSSPVVGQLSDQEKS
uniref:HMA domain-containing protein n=1 Tax=Davidia involucrata TaxID=16924 RepID=A0A5B6ZGK6_DAVIN